MIYDKINKNGKLFMFHLGVAEINFRCKFCSQSENAPSHSGLSYYTASLFSSHCNVQPFLRTLINLTLQCMALLIVTDSHQTFIIKATGQCLRIKYGRLFFWRDLQPGTSPQFHHQMIVLFLPGFVGHNAQAWVDVIYPSVSIKSGLQTIKVFFSLERARHYTILSY